MSFRKRNIVIAQPGNAASNNATTEKAAIPGVRPSPLDGRLTTSTGTRSLDSLLAGHSGLVLGTSLLVEEGGNTDFGGSLLRYYAAEGVVQGHQVHVLGMHESWGRELPGLSDSAFNRTEDTKASEGKMKIAWRYERLGEFGAGARERSAMQSNASSASNVPLTFCHDFDLSKRLTLPSSTQIHFIPISPEPHKALADTKTPFSPFATFLNHITSHLSTSPNSTIHRVIVPAVLSPALYPSTASRPEILLQFLHALRALLRRYPIQLTAIITLPLTLHPRTNGLTRWMELLSDGVLELTPFSSTSIATKITPGSSTAREESPQGMLRIHHLPIFHEKGGGGGEASGFGDDLSFMLSRRKGLVIKPFSLPPVEGDSEAQQGKLDGEEGKATKVDIEF